MKLIDIEDINARLDASLCREYAKPTDADVARLAPMINSILESEAPLTGTAIRILQRKYKSGHKRSFLFQVYLAMVKSGMLCDVSIEKEALLRKTLQIKACKSWSGITSITVFTSPYPEYTNERGERVKQAFSCNWSCSYCPEEPGQPRSYIKGEPGVLRANKNGFDCARQMWDRMHTLYMIGSSPLKGEIIVSGGTWTSYPAQYREEFCRDVYYAANTYTMGKTPLENEAGNRERLTLAEEKRINETAVCRVVGLTIETRPDTINEEELRFLRRLGVTRVQLGVQHIDDQILDKVNRRCSTEKTVKAFELLKRNCFKIDAHWMPNLPGSSEKKDRHMFIDVLLGLSKTMMVPKRYTKQSHTNGAATVEQWEEYDLAAPELQTDQWKIYPTAITPWTEIEKWFKEGTYVQYPEQDVFNLIYDTMSMVWPWIRLNRIIRDIPHCYMYNEETGSDNTNMRQQLDVVLKQDGIHCMDIRNREVKDGQWDGSYGIVIRKYNASNGTEYFISAESADNKTLYGFVRLRLDDARDKAFPELNGCGLIRECHVYGDLSKVGTQGKHVQHRGVGRTVMLRAEELAKSNGYRKLAVISAEGTKRYYMDKLGYQSGVGSDSFLVKVLV